MKKIKYVCPNCGSDKIVFDANAKWNPETQEMELQCSFDFNICESCGEEKTAKEVEIE